MPPQGGPWAECRLSICPQGMNRRRRLLVPPPPCTPVTTSCTFTSPLAGVVAECDLGGLVPQETNLVITTTAVKADGVRASETGAQPTLKLAYYP